MGVVYRVEVPNGEGSSSHSSKQGCPPRGTTEPAGVSRGHRFVRYADDCNIYVKSRRAGERVLASVKRFVEERLKLKVNMAKSAVDRPWNRKFLGFSLIK